MPELRKVKFKRAVWSLNMYDYIDAEQQETGYFHRWFTEKRYGGSIGINRNALIAIIETKSGEMVKANFEAVTFLKESADPEQKFNDAKAKDEWQRRALS